MGYMGRMYAQYRRAIEENFTLSEASDKQQISLRSRSPAQ